MEYAGLSGLVQKALEEGNLVELIDTLRVSDQLLPHSYFYKEMVSTMYDTYKYKTKDKKTEEFVYSNPT